MSVIKHDFGSEKCHTARRFAKLVCLDALHEANVCANPVPYLERASEQIYQLEKTLFEAAQASRPQPDEPPSLETMEIDKAEYRRLLVCRSIIESGLARLGSGSDQT
jgi:hypothetical protein